MSYSASQPDEGSALISRLQQQFGFSEFRPGQGEVITQLLAGQSSLAIFPTGSGKSLCYQFTALQLPHLTLVVSPLLALIKDQLNFLQQKGIKAASIDSTLTPEQTQQVMREARSGQLKLLMVSVERFKNERFRQFIQSIPLSMLVVDEAHCISEWGHNFRPDYLKLPDYCRELSIPLVLLLTATATRKVKQDMAIRFDIKPQHIVQTGFYRSNLDLTVLPVASENKLRILKQQLQSFDGAGIVYVTLQHTAEEVASQLCSMGFVAQAYHAGFDDDKRQQIQHDFMLGQTQIVVATIAFGMGIDKSNIRFVIHYDLPKSIENYCQEIGRAGRDGQLSHCVTLANLDGINTVENFVYGDTPELASIATVIDSISQETQANYWEVQLNQLANQSNIRLLPLKTLLVQLELQGVIKPLYAYYADVQYRFLQPQAHVLSQFSPERQAFLTQIFTHTQMKRVWGSLDFNALYQATGAERNRVLAALEYLASQQLIELETKQITDVYQVETVKLSTPTLAKDLYHYFADKEAKEVARIAQLVRFFELTTCLNYNLARYFDDNAAPKSCGHCSVCRGQVAKLTYSNTPIWPEDQRICADLNELNQLVRSKGMVPLSLETQCRFLAGMSLPIFTRLQVRKLAGFGRCENLRYAEIKQRLQHLI
ncbi:RecQ family ATP-dependent DNA helicase [Shewanella oneidensis MR-1]|uniref:ATP-dependent DNA helicase RecQ n=1 Tax=Shewanella oneidensis (strain ATCC 700550 / JCM 31522 / CIP 106686 / LMG 19005 / NCIMB 14063 / MR-1) TaxID=211586 RepID=Q8EEK1_SHEON|nr:RecQ family ATP-dependent DNA helicase [Shewanella oneidensis]AAN55414.1 ATP-dependent DNA helicase RecQ family [Shewanella oneidensis MR-1]MDX5995927.1 RecQ family ATP-dependent DNA helicase [Shewanella oneidensis]MEE2029724.1 DEAD-box ATP-dependent RNA helicase CshA [Shewanella oneidensis]QKG96919.1 RecQ family ATP-dependent DNA helicase [Shewanella oneidensis MR-1]